MIKTSALISLAKSEDARSLSITASFLDMVLLSIEIGVPPPPLQITNAIFDRSDFMVLISNICKGLGDATTLLKPLGVSTYDHDLFFCICLLYCD